MGERIGFGLYHPVITGGMLDVCLSLGCGDVVGVGGEWVGAWTRLCRGGVVLYQCEM